ncbi:hypothetical protein CQW23_25635 [Capsicum baccatum]|uniref:Ubiquitin-like protease family profile domain-containing protein n=1 Tax=Capsicum baccatum TaxID=33114 RepID=A0A2G2VLG6_CAPBA|nr:hypothetical protein CQW23_25635 [Capsicum baccatum]
MPFFLTLRSIQTLSDPKVVDGKKIELLRATTITIKIILEGGANDAPLTVFETKSHYDYDHNGCTDFSPDFIASSECYSCKCQDCNAKYDGVINVINALTASIKEMTSKRGVISSKKISYSDTPLEIKAAKRRRKDTSKASSIIKRQDFIASIFVLHRSTAEEHSMTVDNPSTASKDEEKVELVSLGERKNYPFEGFNISDEAPKKLTQLINNYSKWIVDGLLKHHASRYYQQQPKVFQNEECLINIIKGFSISAGLPWHLVDEVYIPINCGDEFHWVLAVVVLKERSMIEAYRDKMANPFDVQYVDGISQQTIGSLDCGPFVAVYTEYLSDGLQVPNNGLDARLLRKRYAALLWNYREAKAQKPYATNVKDPRRPKPNSIALDEEQCIHID